MNTEENNEKKERVLVIDDDKGLCSLVAEYLDAEDFEVEIINNGAEGLEQALANAHDIVVLDVMMPKMNGFEVLRRLRAASQVPVLMLTARGNDVDRIVGLEIGADDYLAKPFNPRELVARLRAILRRTKAENKPTEQTSAPSPRQMKIGDVEVDTGTRTVKRDGETIALTSVEYEMLLMLLQAAGRIVQRETLVRAVLGRDLSPFDRSVDIHVSHLRKKLGHTIGDVERIKTVRGIGYIYAHQA